MKRHKRNYKDSVFVDLFSSCKDSKKNFLSLYSALSGKELPDDTNIENIKLRSSVYKGYVNDVAYNVGGKVIVLLEHQSTVNPNMPLRCLSYIGRIYERLLEPQNKYSAGLIKIPAPELYVFYNGIEDYPAESMLWLSSSYIGNESDPPHIEAWVRVININKEKGVEILKRCRILYEYSYFVDAVRRHQKIDEKSGFEVAIDECINNGILEEYLRENIREVRNMFFGEYDYETDIRVKTRESYDAGMKLGEERGEKRGIKLGEKRGEAKGLAKGLSRGEQQSKLRIASQMKLEKFEPGQISKLTGLSLEEVEAL